MGKTKSQLLADLDGVEYYTTISHGKKQTVFKTKCEVCGRTVERKRYLREGHYLCDYCKFKIAEKEKARDEEFFGILKVETKADKRFNQAVENIKKQVSNFEIYNNAINIARTRNERYGSIPEAMVAIELLRLGYKIIPQQKVSNYKVDFAIPKQKIVVEVDGALYHQKRYGGEREAKIQFSLGLDWKIIHIPAEEISKNITKLGLIIEHFK